LVAVLPDPLPWVVNFIAVLTWAIFTFKAFVTVDVSGKWTVAAFNAVFVRTTNTVWIEARWSARTTANMVFLASWTLDWAPAFRPPVDVDTVSGAFSEVSGHSVAWSVFKKIGIRHPANVFLTRIEESGWVDDISAWSVHDVATKHDSFSSFPDTFVGFRFAETSWLLSTVSALVRVSSPRVAESTNLIHGDNPSVSVSVASSPEVVSHIVVENTAKTSGGAFKDLVNFDVDGLFTVPFHHQAVSLFFDDDVTSDVADVDGKESRWKGQSFTIFVEGNWIAFFVLFKVDVGVLKVNLDFSSALLVSGAVRVVNDSNRERTRVSIFNKSVFTAA
jgi:hypothetical protein